PVKPSRSWSKMQWEGQPWPYGVEVTMKRRDLLVGFPVIALGMSGPAQGLEESEIIRLGAEFDTAYARSREAALAARPLYQEWDRKGKGHTVERQFQMQEYFAYQPYADEWSRRSEVAH